MVLAMYATIYVSYGYDFYISVSPWVWRTSQIPVDIKNVAIRHVDSSIHGQNYPLYAKITILSEFFEYPNYPKMRVLRPNVCFEVP